ncbi:MAG: hypothetical protein OK457_02290 [Thaumarchaeota archaeon]|nr:hypothetical protein [Nitrososphaerota archaeon]
MEAAANSKRASARLSILFGALVLVLAFLRSSQIILVVALYVCLLFAGVSIAVFILYSTSPWESKDPRDDSTLTEQRHSKGNDVVSSLNVYVKFASRGSGHSRREIAYILRNILANQNMLRKPTDINTRQMLEKDWENIVHRYIPDNSRIPIDPVNLGFKTKASRQEREAYLASLERIIDSFRNN